MVILKERVKFKYIEWLTATYLFKSMSSVNINRNTG